MQNTNLAIKSIIKTKHSISNKTAMSAALLLLLATSAIAFNIQTASAADTISTYAFISVNPNPIGVGQSATVVYWLNIAPPGATASSGARWEGLTITVTKPDNTTETLGPFKSDSAGSGYVKYAPSQTGNYTFKLNFPGQDITATALDYSTFTYVTTTAYYRPSTSGLAKLTVQENAISFWSESPLPSEYWTNPINAQNRNWYSIMGNWLQSGYDTVGIGSNYNPYTNGPDSAHILWTRPLYLGGLAGGEYGGVAYYSGQIYEPFVSGAMASNPVIIIDGRCYYNNPMPPRTGFYCVDLYSGEQLWYKNYTQQLTFGQVLVYSNDDQGGALAYLWGVSGTTWTMYDAFTGDYILKIQNVPSGTRALDANGNIVVYQYNQAGNWVAMWNSTNCIFNSTPISARMQNGWRPQTGSVADGNLGWQWNMTIHNSAGTAQNLARQSSTPALGITFLNPEDVMIVGPSSFSPVALQSQFGVSLKSEEEGLLLWAQNRTVLPNNQTYTTGCMDAKAGVFTMCNLNTIEWYGFDTYTGDQLWGPKAADTTSWDNFGYGAYVSRANNGYMYACGLAGIIQCYNITTGESVWQYSENAGYESHYGADYPYYGNANLLFGDGKVYALNGGRDIGQPNQRGYKLTCLNATTGEFLWNTLGYFPGIGTGALAGGTFISHNAYDNQLYCYGKGSSSTTVSAPQTAITVGSSFVISGTVLDTSAGTQQDEIKGKYPNGVPAVSDASQSAWMEYLYQDQAKPTNATGVPITINVVDSNGNFRTIGTTTSDASGTYSFVWQPDIEGKYTVIATFAGSDSYYASSAESSFVAVSPPATPTPVPTQAPSAADLYFLPAIAGLFVAIVVSIALSVLVLNKKP
jgi:hypothetical protein